MGAVQSSLILRFSAWPSTKERLTVWLVWRSMEKRPIMLELVTEPCGVSVPEPSGFHWLAELRGTLSVAVGKPSVQTESAKAGTLDSLTAAIWFMAMNSP